MILVIGGTGGMYKAQTRPGITWVAGDLTRHETLTTAFEDAFAVHCAQTTHH